MLDVHPPHTAVHGWRDFFIHIATITIGLLIALGLEGTLEALHHRHLVHEARENLHRELEENEVQARENVGSVESDAANMKHNATLAQTLLSDKHAFEHQKMSFTFTWSSFNDSAWRSARDSGALSFMPVSEVQRYADSYAQQEIVNREAVSIFTRQPELAGNLMFVDQPNGLSQDQVQALRNGSAATYYRLLTLKQLIEELDGMYRERLKP